MPHTRLWSATEPPSTVGDSPASAASGRRKSPKVCLTPRARLMEEAAAAIRIQTAGGMVRRKNGRPAKGKPAPAHGCHAPAGAGAGRRPPPVSELAVDGVPDLAAGQPDVGQLP